MYKAEVDEQEDEITSYDLEILRANKCWKVLQRVLYAKRMELHNRLAQEVRGSSLDAMGSYALMRYYGGQLCTLDLLSDMDKEMEKLCNGGDYA